MLESKYAGCTYCIMCFRLFPAAKEFASGAPHTDEEEEVQQPWAEHSVDEIQKFVLGDQPQWQKPAFARLIETELIKITPPPPNVATRTMTLVCKHCSGILRKKKKTTHTTYRSVPPMQLVLNYIMSGGCTLCPGQRTLTHCIESLVFRFPSNPIVGLRQDIPELSLLRERIQLVTHHLTTHFNGGEFSEFMCLLRWVAEGGQHIMTDADLARKMRRYIEKHEDVVDWWKERVPSEAACSNCYSCKSKELHAMVDGIVPRQDGSSLSSIFKYSSAAPGYKTQMGLDAIKDDGIIMDGVTVFCPICGRVSAISYEYDCLVKSAVGGVDMDKYRDCYYERMIRIAQWKKDGLLEALAKATTGEEGSVMRAVVVLPPQ